MNHTKKYLYYAFSYYSLNALCYQKQHIGNGKISTLHSVQFPASFEWGLTTLSYEVEGYSKSSTWYTWENHTGNNSNTPFTTTRSGNAAAHAQNYQEDVQLMKEMGITTYCFSLDWSRIEPEQGYFDETSAAILCRSL